MREIVTRSRLDAPPEAVWARVAGFDGINDEFQPWMKMTAPRDVKARGLEGLTVGERICRSWIVLFGVIPFATTTSRWCASSVAFVPRFGQPAALVAPIVRRTFRHRHARLRRRFGGRSLPTG